ncbi:MAG: PD-(D/E)XK nuclease family protein [Elusimicrobiota bacterium]
MIRPLSHSAIHTYLDCPQKWKLKYIDKLPEKPRHFFSFGKTLHSALEFLYNVPVPPPPSLEQVMDYYEGHWLSEGYTKPSQEQEYREEGRRILNAYYRKHMPDFHVPFFVEYRFEAQVQPVEKKQFSLKIGNRQCKVSLEPEFLAPVPLLGFVDRIDKLEDGTLELIDYKTGKSFDMDRVREDPQLTLYQMVCEEKLGPVSALTLYHLPSQTPFRVPRHGPELVQALRERIAAVAGLIRRGRKRLDAEGPAALVPEFAPEVGDPKCKWCDFQPHCPAWKQAYAPAAAAPVEEERAPALKSDKQIERWVDRFGKLKEEIRVKEEEAEEVKARIIEQLKLHGYVRAFGTGYEVALHTDEKWEFKDADKPKVLETIQRAGFWEKILAPSAPLVQKVMNDPTLPLDLRDRLHRLSRKAEHHVLRVKKIEEEA